VDRRAIFVVVFFFTLLSTVLVAVVSFLSGQGWLHIALYSLATMWIVGVLSQLLLQNLYSSIIRPYEEEKRQRMLEEQMKQEIDIEQVEAVEDVEERVEELSQEIKRKKKSSIQEENAKAHT
jgi:hypothetical protein